jgi:predicted dehydrogenase
MEKIKLGFVGAGFMGQRAHMRNYAALDGCEIVALAEARPQLANDVARCYNIPNVFGSHKEMITACKLDAVVASQPFGNHINVVPDILDAGLHVLTEKPLCITVENGEMLAGKAKQSGKVYMVGYHKRSDPAMEYAIALIDQWKKSGEYGSMRYVRITMPSGDWIGGNPRGIETNEPYPSLPLESYPSCFDEKTGQAYISFVNYYIHQVNALRFLLGEPYKLAYADKSGVLFVAESQSGICGTIEMSPYSTTIDWQESILVAFEKGTIKIDLPAPLAMQLPGQVTILRDNGIAAPTVTLPMLPCVSAMQNQAKNFLKAIRKEIKPPCDAAEAVDDLKVSIDYIKMMCK